MSEQRLEWIDVAKAIGIILVFIGHCDISGVNSYIYYFHMPLFFIISGLCWNIEKNKTYGFVEFVKKKFKSYVIPYFKICLICLVLLGIPEALLKFGLTSEFFVLIEKYLTGIVLLSKGSTEWLPHCSPVWFLTCLFCAEVVMWFVMKQKKPWAYVIALGSLGYVMSLVGKFPWNIDTACTAIPLIYVGVLIKDFLKNYSNIGVLVLLFCLSTLFLLFGLVEVDFDANRYENILLMYAGSIVVSLTILAATRLVFGGGNSYRLSERKLCC